MTSIAIAVSIFIFILLAFISIIQFNSINEENYQRNLRGHIFTRSRHNYYDNN